MVGAALFDAAAYQDEHARGLRPYMFSDSALGRVWQAIGTTIESGKPVGTLEVYAHLGDDARLNISDLAELQAGIPSAANISYYGDRVLDAYVHRELDRLPELLRDEEDPRVRARDFALRARNLTEFGGSQRIKVHRDWSGAAPSREWICNGWLGYRLTLFTGHGGRGKSRLALQLAAAVASGASSSWIPPEPDSTPTVPCAAIDASGAPVLLASWEDEQDEVHRRLQTMAADKRLPWAASERIEDRLHFADMAGYGPLWETTDYSNNGKLTGTGHELREIAERIKARLLIIDPRAAAYAGDENNRAQVRAFISHWDRWARETRCAVLIVDHLPKYASKPRPSGSDEPSYAGSTDWHNAARSVWTLERTQNKDTVLRCDKSNYGPAPEPVYLASGDGCAWFATTDRATAGVRRVKGVSV